jgi:hypothetical protein
MVKRNYTWKQLQWNYVLELDAHSHQLSYWLHPWFIGIEEKKVRDFQIWMIILFNQNVMIASSNSAIQEDSKWSRIKRKTKRILNWFLTILVIAGCLFIYWKYFYTYSDGYRAGLLQKFSHKGNIIKTYEGEMILSSVSSSRNVALASDKFYFSVSMRNLAQKLDTLQGQMVIVHYMQKNAVLFWHGDSEYIVDSVKVIH